MDENTPLPLAYSWGPHYAFANTWVVSICKAHRHPEGYYSWSVRIIGLDHIGDKSAQRRARRLAQQSGCPLFPEVTNHALVTRDQLAQLKAAVGRDSKITS